VFASQRPRNNAKAGNTDKQENRGSGEPQKRRPDLRDMQSHNAT